MIRAIASFVPDDLAIANWTNSAGDTEAATDNKASADLSAAAPANTTADWSVADYTTNWSMADYTADWATDIVGEEHLYCSAAVGTAAVDSNRTADCCIMFSYEYEGFS